MSAYIGFFFKVLIKMNVSISNELNFPNVTFRYQKGEIHSLNINRSDDMIHTISF